MRDVCLDGPSHFLGHEQTMALMQRDYVYPDLGDRNSPKDWNEAGRPDLLEQARCRVKQLLSTPRPQHVPDDIDRQIRERFPVKLSLESMGG